jgi:hypothetical protein
VLEEYFAAHRTAPAPERGCIGARFPVGKAM